MNEMLPCPFCGTMSKKRWIDEKEHIPDFFQCPFCRTAFTKHWKTFDRLRKLGKVIP